MHRSLTAVALVMAAASLTTTAQQSQTPTFRGGSETVRVFATSPAATDGSSNDNQA
jgi:hypothetical protein